MAPPVWCLLINHENKPIGKLFRMPPEEYIADLKDGIKNKNPVDLQSIDAHHLVVWRCKDKSTVLNPENMAEQVRELFSNEGVEMLNETTTMAGLRIRKNEKLLVQIPMEEGTSAQHKRSSEAKCSLPKRPKKTLPSIAALIGALKEPLADSEKISVSEPMYNSFISGIFPDRCDENDVGSLFKIGEVDWSFFRFFTAVSASPPTGGGTEESFHAFWDDNIRRIVEFSIPTGTTIRNSNQISTRNLRPGYGFILKKTCAFRGEEKGSATSGNPRAELAEKLVWTYDPAPYMLGYYCRETAMTLVAITAPDSPGGTPKVHDLISLDLRWRKDRIANIRHLINLSAILARLPELVQFPSNDFQLFERTNSTVEITSTLIVKTYTCENPEAKVANLQRIYKILDTRRIPNTDSLHFTKKNIAYLGPRGIIDQPWVEKELRECIICILESLIIAHQVPIYHRDIRWPNVIRRIDDHSKWILIDWEDAGVPPTMAQPSFSRSTHPPAVFVDGHGADVDIWGVGYLIKTCTAADVSMKFRALGQHICEESQTLSAQNVLTLLDTISSDPV